MPNPLLINLPADQWVLVAVNVTGGIVWVKDSQSHLYIHTYVITGDPAPSGVDIGAPFLNGSGEIRADAAIDVYVMSQNVDGQVRVDL